MPPSPNLRIEISEEKDIPRLMEIFVPAFENITYSQLVGLVNTSEGLQNMAKHYLTTWHEQALRTSVPFSIKCIHTDPSTGKETIISQANWVIYDKSRSEEDVNKPIYLLRAEWVEDESKRNEACSWIAPAQTRRARWFGGKPHGELYFMATDPKFERLGAGTLCVKWGLEKCRELGIPAWLEASVQGMPMYQRLGFEVALEEGEELLLSDGRGRPMVWWPEGYGEGDKRPVLENE